jgi:6-phosphogluconolactonase
MNIMRRSPRAAALVATLAATLFVSVIGITPARAGEGGEDRGRESSGVERDDDRDDRSFGAVFEVANAAGPNAIQVYLRAGDGRLTAGPVVPTGGQGAGNSLGSQGGVVREGDHLFVVNAGDNTISSLSITDNSVEVRDIESSGGVRPVSVTVHDNLVYTVNAGSDTISGFSVDRNGILRPIPNSTRPLSGTGVGAAQIQFDTKGSALVVTEKATNRILTYPVGRDGLTGTPTVTTSVGRTPFGFEIDKRNRVIVSEAASGSLSSYNLDGANLAVVSGAVSDAQAAPCWVALGRKGRFAYTTNAASNSISSYTIERNGALTLLASVAAPTGAGPTDMAVSENGKFMYVRVRSGTVEAFAIAKDGALTSLGSANGTASIGSSGLAAF